MKHVSLLAMTMILAAAAPLPPQAAAWQQHNTAALKKAWAQRVARDPGLATAAVEPSLLSGRVVTPVVNVLKAPGLATIEIKYDGGTVGLAQVQVVIQSPSGAHSFLSISQLPSYPPLTGTRAAQIELIPAFGAGFGLYAEPGKWTIENLTLQSIDGTFVTYGGQQLAAVFPNSAIPVENPGTPDTQPPSVVGGKLITSTVSLSGTSPYFVAQLAAKDNLSGVNSVSVELQPPDGNFPVYANGGATAPQLKRTLDAGYLLTSASPTGTWLIIGFGACDFAGNCFNDTSSADVQKLFGTTTFSVTD